MACGRGHGPALAVAGLALAWLGLERRSAARPVVAGAGAVGGLRLAGAARGARGLAAAAAHRCAGCWAWWLLWAAWLALVHARSVGINFLLSVLCLVWMADIAAYFGGRAFGRRKLAPSISPGKSWEGVWSGMAGRAAAGGLLGWMWTAGGGFDGPSLFTRLWHALGRAWAWWPLAAGTGGMSVVGDLVESLVKRAAGAKDSSRLLPGHGGVLDRVDALLPVSRWRWP
jgi:phosphatidate cytidylyltransferase